MSPLPFAQAPETARPRSRERDSDSSRHDNMRLLIALRWIAVAGQFATIVIVHWWMAVELPVAAMLAIVAGLVALNLVGMSRLTRASRISNAEIFASLLIDVAALTALLFLSGGATNPFIWLFVLQVVLSAVLLDLWSTWTIVALSSIAFVYLVYAHVPLVLPPGFALGLFDLYLLGALVAFVLVTVLLTLFVTRINANLRASDRRLAELRQQAAEEDHIVRMGMLATGAAHEFGTPLASLAVVANDWSHRADLLAIPDLAEEIEDVRVAVERCRAIVTGILTSAGEVRGERPGVTTLGAFLDAIAVQWNERAAANELRVEDCTGGELPIVADIAFEQVIWNLLDNAAEASGAAISIIAERIGTNLVLTVRDGGPGFDPDILRDFGKPYRSTKQKQGGGLGLFLVVNVVRKMGGRVEARNGESGGASVIVTLPLEVLAWTEGSAA